VGIWRGGKLHGQGKKTFSNGASIEGMFNQGELIGAYTHSTPQGMIKQVSPIGGDRLKNAHLTFSLIEKASSIKVLCEYIGPIDNWSNINTDKCFLHLL
jgi:hypothetical protein